MKDQSGRPIKPRAFAVPVRVSCGAGHCLAYKDQEGNWLEYFDGKKITGPVRILQFEELYQQLK